MSLVQSPFKFLDSYQQADADVFFGREKETTDMYNALSGVKHLMVYGPSGSGKTSLVECGLRNRFSDADWFALTIRKGANINASIFTGINDALKAKIDVDKANKLPVDPEIGLVEAVDKLFKEQFQPIYLLFDQFEELLISGDAEEKHEFFEGLSKLIRNKVPCRIMLILREEFIGHMSEFESVCPSIFQHRFRVEKMGRKNVEEVIYHILEAPRYQSFFKVDDSLKLTETILSKLPDMKKEIELAHVQVFLGELWDRALDAGTNEQLPVLSADLIHHKDNLEGILESFLKKQMTELEKDYGKRMPLELLAVMISERFSKLQISETTIKTELEHKKVVGKKPIADLLRALEQRRIIRTIKANDETQYEISHDLLALVVGQNLTEEMQLREKAAGIYEVYMERQGLFSEDDLDYIRPFENYKEYPEELRNKIADSKDNLASEQEKELKEAKVRADKEVRLRNKADRAFKISLGVATLAIVAALAAIWFYYDANEAKIKADASTEIAQQEKIKADTSAAIAQREKNNAENLLAKLTTANVQIVKDLQRTIDQNILELDYSSALENTKTALNIGGKEEEFTPFFQEIAYFYTESGQYQHADMVLRDISNSVSTSNLGLEARKKVLREKITTIDPDHYKTLEKRYYPEMVSVPGGDFDAGYGSDVRSIKLGPFYIAKTETTGWQYNLYIKAQKTGSSDWSGKGNEPAVHVSWDDAGAYMEWISARRGLTFRLPKEAEWEYAARGGTNWRDRYNYSGSNTITMVAWCEENSSRQQPVASLEANKLGLYDMSGNVWEWCSEFEKADRPQRVLRGGSWRNSMCRVTARIGLTPEYETDDIGFRCARSQ